MRCAFCYTIPIRLWVICPESPQVCVRRVQRRKSEGGHGRSAGKIRELYDSALHVASELSILSDETLLIDSSDRSEFQVVGYVREFCTTISVQPAPNWVTEHFPDDKL